MDDVHATLSLIWCLILTYCFAFCFEILYYAMVSAIGSNRSENQIKQRVNELRLHMSVHKYSDEEDEDGADDDLVIDEDDEKLTPTQPQAAAGAGPSSAMGSDSMFSPLLPLSGDFASDQNTFPEEANTEPQHVPVATTYAKRSGATYASSSTNTRKRKSADLPDFLLDNRDDEEGVDIFEQRSLALLKASARMSGGSADSDPANRRPNAPNRAQGSKLLKNKKRKTPESDDDEDGGDRGDGDDADDAADKDDGQRERETAAASAVAGRRNRSAFDSDEE